MEYSKLVEKYDELLERLDKYYHRELMNEPRAKVNLETYKEELLHVLQIELWKVHKKGKYDAYDLEKLIWMKAKKIWIAFTRKLDQKCNQKNDIEFANLPENSFVSDFLPAFESKNAITIIESFLKESEIELLRQRMEGLSYNEIKQISGYTSEDAAKTKFNRMKKLIQLRFGRF